MKTYFLFISCLMLLLSVIMVVFRDKNTQKRSTAMGILIAATALIAMLTIIRILIV